MPTLVMILIAFALTFNFNQRFSVGTQKRFTCKLGSKRRRVLLLACETLLPDMGRLPVTAQTLAMVNLFQSSPEYRESPPEDGHIQPAPYLLNSSTGRAETAVFLKATDTG